MRKHKPNCYAKDCDGHTSSRYQVKVTEPDGRTLFQFVYCFNAVNAIIRNHLQVGSKIELTKLVD